MVLHTLAESPDEWYGHETLPDGLILWQNRICSSVFTNDHGATYSCVDYPNQPNSTDPNEAARDRSVDAPGVESKLTVTFNRSMTPGQMARLQKAVESLNYCDRHSGHISRLTSWMHRCTCAINNEDESEWATK